MTLTRCLVWGIRKSACTSRLNSCVSIRWLSSGYPSHEVIGLPALSPTMEVGTIGSWKIEEGAEFGPGQVLAEIETDKATMDFEAQDEGVLAKILTQPGLEIPVGTPIGVVVEDVADVEAFADYVLPDGTDSSDSTATSESTPTNDTPVSQKGEGRTVSREFILTPAARHISQSKGLDASVLPGTGKGGRVTKGDVLHALSNNVHMPSLVKATAAATPSPAAPAVPVTPAAPIPLALEQITIDTSNMTFEDVPNNNMRKVIAKRLTESKSTVPHFYTTVQITLDQVLKLRKQLLPVKVSVNDVIVRAAALACRDVPEVNHPSNNNNDVDISIAVATPTGLITPIVPNTDNLGLHDISTKIKDLATRARDNKLKPEEYQGGTFCISNLGMFGITEFSAVINPPQAAILAVGGGIPTVVPGDTNMKPNVLTLMTARLSADRRVIDEPTASLFLQTFQHYLNNPQLLVL